MAKLVEVGVWYPCAIKGIEIPIDDEETEMLAGDVFEARWDADGDIPMKAAFDIIVEVLKMKEEYPYFVWHGLKIETRRITVQFSVAPPGQETGNPIVISGLVKLILILVGGLLALILGGYAIYLALKRGYLLPVKPPQGDLHVWAKDETNGIPLPNVQVSVAGQIKTTGPNGEAVLFKDLTAGQYTVFGAIVDGYHQPDPVIVTVKDKQVSEVKLQYFDSAQPKPEHGYVIVYTEPVTGEVTIGGVPYGPAPVGPIQLQAGDTIAVGYSYVEGYVTPPIDVFTVPRGDTQIVIGRYTLPGFQWPQFEPWMKYLVIGGAAVIGGAILIPRLMETGRSRPKEGS